MQPGAGGDSLDGLRRYLPRVLLTEEEHPPHWRRNGTLLFADVSGFTALSERLARAGRDGAEVLVATISRIFTPLLEVCETHGGDVLKFGGDALLLFFDGPDHLSRACSAADGMRRTLRRVGTVPVGTRTVTLRMSQGLHTGDFDFFLVGTRHQELIVAGAAASETVAMETAASAQEVLVSAAAAAQLPASRLGEARAGGRLLLRGAPVPHQRRAPDPPPAAEAPALERFVPLALRGRLDDIVAESEHRQATVAFLHFFGIDGLLAERGAAEVHRRLHSLTDAVVEAMADFGVCIICTDVGPDGGKFMLASGVPEAQEDADERMLRALRAVLDVDHGLPVRVGVNRGRVYGGAVGGPSRFTYSTMGDAVNLAARVMGKAQTGQLLATTEVVARCGSRFETSALPPFSVKGKTQPVTAFAVGRSVRAARRRADDSPFVGRRDLITRFGRAYVRAAGGAGSVIELVGDAGVGKSRLLREATASLPAPQRLEVHCEHYDSATPYFAARTLLVAALGLHDAGAPDAAADLLRARVLALAPEIEPWLPLLGDVLDVALPPTPEVAALVPRLRRQRLGDVTRTVLRAALPTGTVLVIEDSCWMDEASADLLVPVLSTADRDGWLVCLSRRPIETGLHAGLGYPAELIELAPLSAEDSLALLVEVDEGLTPHTARQLVERSGGSPLFLLQLGAATAAGADLEALPDDVETVVASRIDRLSPRDRRLLRYASVLGVRFPDQDLQDVLGEVLGQPPAPDDWNRLTGFVRREPDGAVRFENELIRKVAYDALPFAARRWAHGAAGRLLEASRAEEHLELLSLHFHRAQDYERAWRYSRAAGDRALGLYANLEAVELYRRAVDSWRQVPSATPADLAQVCEAMGDALEVTSQYDAAKAAYARARALARSDQGSCPRLMLKEGVLRERLGRYPAAVRWYGRALRQLAAGAAPDADTVHAKLLVGMAATRFRQGRLEDCVRWAERAAAAAEVTGRRGTQAHAYFLLDSALTDLGRSGAKEYRSRALPIYEELGDLVGQANVLNNLGIDAYYEGHWDEALELYERSRDLRLRAGDVMGAATAANNLAEILSDQGRVDEAEALFRDAGRVFRSVGYTIGTALVTSNLGRAAGRAGRHAQALQLLSDALAAFRSIGAGIFVLEAQARTAEVLLASGAEDEALRLTATALPAAVGAEAAVARTMLERIRGLCLAQQGQPEEGRVALIESVQTAESCGAVFEEALSLISLAFVEQGLGLARAAERCAAARGVLDRLDVRDLGSYRMCDPALLAQATS